MDGGAVAGSVVAGVVVHVADPRCRHSVVAGVIADWGQVALDKRDDHLWSDSIFFV